MQGVRHDANVSSEVAAERFDTVDAPSKRLIWFEHSAHEIMAEEPGRMFDALVRLVRPIAVQAGDAARRMSSTRVAPASESHE